jgi:hypothetical protein
VGKLKCGEFAGAFWNFELSEKPNCHGYFVQKIEGHCQVDRSCLHCPNQTKLKPNVVFWEAFEVDDDRWAKDRQHVLQNPTKPLFTDMCMIIAHNGTCGNITWRGFVRFYCDDKTGDLGGFGRNPADPSSKWRVDREHGEGDCKTNAGGAPSTTDEPQFWRDGTGDAGSAYRDLGGYWNCCCGRRGFFDAFATPSQ